MELWLTLFLPFSFLLLFFLNETSLVPPFRVEGLIVRKGIDLFAYKLHEFSVVGLEA